MQTSFGRALDSITSLSVVFIRGDLPSFECIRLCHQQVRYYRLFEDEIDGEGHGTHCAGSAVGGLAGGQLLNALA
jgi:hypothetical protein